MSKPEKTGADWEKAAKAETDPAKSTEDWERAATQYRREGDNADATKAESEIRKQLDKLTTDQLEKEGNKLATAGENDEKNAPQGKTADRRSEIWGERGAAIARERAARRYEAAATRHQTESGDLLKKAKASVAKGNLA